MFVVVNQMYEYNIVVFTNVFFNSLTEVTNVIYKFQMSHETMNFIFFFYSSHAVLHVTFWTSTEHVFFNVWSIIFKSTRACCFYFIFEVIFSRFIFFHTWIFHVFWFFTHNHILFTWFHMSFLKFIFEISGHNHGIMFFTHEHMLLSYFHTMWYMITNEVYVIFR